jgi:hypothetical protein
MKRQTKADRILNQALERMEIARTNVETAEIQIAIARASYDAHQMAYYALKKELEPTPRKKREKPASGPVALKGQAKTEAVLSGSCSRVLEDGTTCLAAPDNPIHFPEFAGNHSFERPKSVARAPRKSKQKPESAPSTQSIEGETENALVASSGGD